MGMECEIGLRRRTYNVLAGCVLSVWTKVEDLLNSRAGHNSKMQVVRLRSSDGLKIVGKNNRNLLPRIPFTFHDIKCFILY